MSGRSERRGGEAPRTWLRGVLIIVAVAALTGALSGRTGLNRPTLGPLNIAGFAVMIAGLIVSLLATALSGRVPEEKRDAVSLALRLGGVGLCGVGAIMVFI